MSSRRCIVSLCALAGLVTAAAPVASAATPTPTVRSISPKKVTIGQKLTIRGKNFLPGKRRTTVVFKRDKRPAVFVRASSASRTRLVVVVPRRLGAYMAVRRGSAAPTRFRVRVLAKRFGRRWTSLKSSPVISSDGSTVADDCDGDKIPNASDPDDDNDTLLDTEEGKYRTDPCKADTDGDGMQDAWEAHSAFELNDKVKAFYPVKRPYPNPLDPSDTVHDFDGDGLSAAHEHAVWQKFAPKVPGVVPVPNDGNQRSFGCGVEAGRPANLVLRLDGCVTDDEQDSDGDGLTTWDEINGRATRKWILARYEEIEFPTPMLEPDYLDADSDGDGLKDGDDDQDHDGWSNIEELVRGPYWVHMYNPCLPDPDSRVCTLHPPFEGEWPPFPSPPPQRPLPWGS